MKYLKEIVDFDVDWKVEGVKYLEGLNPKENALPKGVISLENNFDKHYMY